MWVRLRCRVATGGTRRWASSCARSRRCSCAPCCCGTRCRPTPPPCRPTWPRGTCPRSPRSDRYALSLPLSLYFVSNSPLSGSYVFKIERLTGLRAPPNLYRNLIQTLVASVAQQAKIHIHMHILNKIRCIYFCVFFISGRDSPQSPMEEHIIHTTVTGT